MKKKPTKKRSETVLHMLKRGKQLRVEFEKRQAELAAAQKAYDQAKTVIIDFDQKYGRVVKLFEDE